MIKKLIKKVPSLYLLGLNIKQKLWQRETKKQFFKYINNTKQPSLQLGAGSNKLEGWFNTDYFARPDIFFLDATKTFPFPDNSFEFIFSEHHIEHISYKHATEMVKEAFRVMRPGGYIRISTPDLQKQLISYMDDSIMKTEKEQHAKEWIYGGFHKAVDYLPVDDYYQAHLINDVFYNYEHRFIYDYKSLAKILEKAGFEDIVNCSVKDSLHPEFNNIETHNSEFEKYFTLAVEAKKPFCLQKCF